MGYFRNPEIRRELVIWSAVLLVPAIVGRFFLTTSEVLLYFVVGVLFSVAHFLSSFFRYKRIAALAEIVEQCLHGKVIMEIAEQSEGELAILQTEIQKLMQKLVHQAKMLQNDKVYLMNSIADISHQIRTPLTAINLILSRLSTEDLEKEKKRELMRDLDSLLRHMEWLVETLLKIAKLDAGTIQMKKELVFVGELIQQSIEDLLIPMELRGQKLTILCEKNVSFIGDLAWTKESLVNILKNCMEHTPSGGEIFIVAEENALYTSIVIKDNGPGIAKEDLPHIFERFYKGKHTSEKSVGIGLALARMIVKEQGGTLEAMNLPKKGACFEMKFYRSVV